MKIFKTVVKKKHKFNFAIFFLMLILLSIGCLFVYSASFYQAEITYGDKAFFLKKQIIGVVVGLAAFTFFSLLDYHFLRKFRWWLFGISVVLLLAVFIPGIGVTNYGATRWINLKITTFQPSEIAKLALIVLSSSILSKSTETIKSFKGLLPVLLIGGVYCALIIVEPNMSITICIALLTVVMLFVGGARIKHFLILSVPAVLLVIGLIVAEPYRLKRLIAFVDPFASKQDEGFQLVQSLLGIALGSAFGSGIFKSRQKYLFLPFSESDFIFSVIAEETGFVGSLALICLFIFLFLAIMKVARNAPDKFGFLLSVGVGAVIIIQVLLNLAVVTGLIPPTGLPLPFISSGSTSIMIFMGMLGIVQNVHKKSVY